MPLFLRPAQVVVLRRCSTGLRVWEVGSELTLLFVELKVLQELQLITFEEGSGYASTPRGEAWLIQFDE